MDETSYDYTIIAIIDPGTDTDFVIFGQSEISGSDDVNHYYSYNNTGKFNVDEYSPYGGGVFSNIISTWAQNEKNMAVLNRDGSNGLISFYHNGENVGNESYSESCTGIILIYTQYLEQELLVGHFQNWIMH